MVRRVMTFVHHLVISDVSTSQVADEVLYTGLIEMQELPELDE